MANQVAQLIRAYARKYGIDPRAALAVASVEGGIKWGAVGDQGSSYGPFQLHRGGALGSHSAAWANSPAGIEYALRSMARSGAKGLSGRAAIEAIVRNFERPAAPGAEIQRALSAYGAVPAGSAGQAPSMGGAISTPTAPGADRGDLRRQLALQLLGNLQGGQGKGVADLTETMGLVRQLKAPPEPAAPTMAAPSSPAASGAQSFKGIDPRLPKLAETFGLTITSGRRSESQNRQTGGAPGSYHLSGRAIDVGVGPGLRALAGYARQHPERFLEFFWDDLGWYIKRGKIVKGAIGGHGDHGHIALAS